MSHYFCHIYVDKFIAIAAKDMKLIELLEVNNSSKYSVLCHSSGQWYVGHGDGVDIITDGQSSRLTSNNISHVECIREYGG
jgi:hypothetical protein